MVSTVINEETGEEKKRLINRMRWKGYGPATITFTDVTVSNVLIRRGMFRGIALFLRLLVSLPQM